MCDHCRATLSFSHPITGCTLTRLTGAGQSPFCPLAITVSHVAREHWLEVFWILLIRPRYRSAHWDLWNRTIMVSLLTYIWVTQWVKDWHDMVIMMHLILNPSREIIILNCRQTGLIPWLLMPWLFASGATILILCNVVHIFVFLGSELEQLMIMVIFQCRDATWNACIYQYVLLEKLITTKVKGQS